MKRKQFLSTALMTFASVSSGKLIRIPASGSTVRDDPDNNPGKSEAPRIPPNLKPGDMIGITCPAGWISEEEILPAIQEIRNWGFLVRLGDTIGKRDFTFGGTDDERVADFQRMLDDRAIKAILCARGGYGSVRIIDRLNFTRFAGHPKWIIGFSDITVIHSHLNRNYGIASLHSKMCNSFPADWSTAEPLQIDSILSIRDALLGKKLKYPVDPAPENKPGTAVGVLVGGNLKTLESLSASRSDIRTDGKILFVEDTGEYLYSIDRMFWNLKRSGKLAPLKGLVVGGFRVKPDDPGEEFGMTVEEIVLEKIRNYHFPVCFNFPVGHQKNNFALKCGVPHRLSVTENACTLIESR